VSSTRFARCSSPGWARILAAGMDACRQTPIVVDMYSGYVDQACRLHEAGLVHHSVLNEFSRDL